MQSGYPYALEKNALIINTKIMNISEINIIKEILLSKYNIESFVYSNNNENFNFIINNFFKVK